LKPTDLAMHVNDLLVKHFPDVVDVGFTAAMEEHLDAVADGNEQWVPVIRDFYKPFKANLIVKDKEVKKSDLEEPANVACDKCGRPMVFKFGRNGKFMACTGYTDKKNPCKNAKPVPGSEEAMTPEPTDEVCDCKGGGEGKKKCKHEGVCGAPMAIKRSQYGQFLGCSRYPECQNRKPLLKKTGVKCPKCKEGDIVEKKTIRGGRIFYGCSRYAKDGLGCDFIMQAKPTGQECPKCGSLVMYGKQDTVRCSSKECDYTADAPTPPPSATPAEGAETAPEPTSEEETEE
jgi:DNA topoisomerase-1